MTGQKKLKSIASTAIPNLFEFIEGSSPKGFQLAYEPSLYNSDVHRSLQSKNKWHSFHIIRRDKKKVLASIHFCILEGIAKSPISAPFGSFDLSNSVPPSQLFEFINFYEKRLVDSGARKIVIKNFPEAYHSRQHSILSVLFINHKYSVNDTELGAILSVDEVPLVDKLDPWERRKLRQAAKEGLTFRIISNKNLKDTFQFILDCRKERDQSLSMSYVELGKTVKKLDKSFICFGVYRNKELVAASISIKESRTTLYNFYSAHSRDSDALSPIVFLINQMYGWCSLHKIKLLDLGTSALGGIPNFPLIDFKLRLGAVPAMKLTFEKNLT